MAKTYRDLGQVINGSKKEKIRHKEPVVDHLPSISSISSRDLKPRPGNRIKKRKKEIGRNKNDVSYDLVVVLEIKNSTTRCTPRDVSRYITSCELSAIEIQLKKWTEQSRQSHTRAKNRKYLQEI